MILHLITNFSASAGAETMLARLLKASSDERVMVVSLLDVSARNRDLADNPRVEYVALGAHSLPAILQGTMRLASIIRQEKPSVMLCWMYHAMVVGTVAAKLARRATPVIWNVRQSLDDVASLSRSSYMAIAAARALSGSASGIIYNSSRACEMHRAYGYRNLNSVVIPNGFEIPAVSAGHEASPRRIGIVARFHPQKDHATFFRAAASVLRTHPDTRFLAAGRGLAWDNPEVVRLIADAGLPSEAIDLRGEVADMEDFYRSIDILALSSRTEGFPNVVAEAMSYAKMVVATDVGDAAEVAGNAGIVVPARNPEAFADAMRKVLDLSPEEYARYAHLARDRIESEYTLHHIERRYSNYLRNF
ncbi:MULTISPECIES: glycosyltransferase [unclassified Ensifer]|uniref:glycosyltransferase n=1 Tax=unclassified Ensifer TaxID=2633371 RepID=UPI00071276D1|nr:MULTISPECIES: glycosyltransferase [unclassified Ensifer]KQX27795.1 glycosyl transferase [Ensifer sp. Root423]KQZ53314.1 glycosyl transferase [Ensifer sp. Root558]